MDEWITAPSRTVKEFLDEFFEKLLIAHYHSGSAIAAFCDSAARGPGRSGLIAGERGHGRGRAERDRELPAAPEQLAPGLDRDLGIKLYLHAIT
jgi:hypothetical protein